MKYENISVHKLILLINKKDELILNLRRRLIRERVVWLEKENKRLNNTNNKLKNIIREDAKIISKLKNDV